jgi:hypothetical protein
MANNNAEMWVAVIASIREMQRQQERMLEATKSLLGNMLSLMGQQPPSVLPFQPTELKDITASEYSMLGWPIQSALTHAGVVDCLRMGGLLIADLDTLNDLLRHSPGRKKLAAEAALTPSAVKTLMLLQGWNSEQADKQLVLDGITS